MPRFSYVRSYNARGHEVYTMGVVTAPTLGLAVEKVLGFGPEEWKEDGEGEDAYNRRVRDPIAADIEENGGHYAFVSEEDSTVVVKGSKQIACLKFIEMMIRISNEE